MNIAIIVGAGSGTRMASKINKVFLTLIDKPIIAHTIEKFENCKEINTIIIVARKDEMSFVKKLIEDYQFKKISNIVEGGKERQDSVYNGIKAIEDPSHDDVIVIQNAANPFVSKELIVECINSAAEYGASVAAIKCKDTIKESDMYGNVKKTLDRTNLWQTQTPQCIKYYIAKEAFEKAYQEGFYGTDDVMLVERLDKEVKIIECDEENIKITTESDFLIAQQIQGNARIGLGQDSHMFSDKEKDLVLGGIIIPNEYGLESNSDGDVILHALFNALSTAIGGLSIGNYADFLYNKGITDSRRYLKIPLKKIEKKELTINNIAIMIEAKKPTLREYEVQMKENIAKLCNIDNEKVGIAITSGESLTSFGKGLGIQCFAAVSLIRT